LFFEPLGSTVETGARIDGIANEAAPQSRSNMRRTIGSILMTLMGDDGTRFDRLGKIFGDPVLQPLFNMRPQRAVNVEVLSFD